MRKTIALLFSFAAALLLPCSCNDSFDPAPEKVVVRFGESSLTVPYTGGTYSISYELSGVPEGTIPEVAGTDDGWIGNLSIDADGIGFEVLPNTERQARSCEITVLYDGTVLENRIAVQQGEYAPGDETFGVAVTAVTEHSVTFDVIPGDKQMTWYCGVCDREEMDAFASDDAFVEHLAAQLREEAETAGRTLEELLDEQLRTGDLTSGVIEGLEDGTDMYLYVLGMTRNGVGLTGVSKEPFSTELSLTFDITYEIEKANVTAVVVPSIKDRYYVCEAMKTSDYQTYADAQAFKDAYQEMLNFLISFSGQSPEDFVRSNCYMGDARISSWKLEAATEYTGYVFEVSTSGELVSFATTKAFTTGSVEMSDNTFEITFTEITEDSAAGHIETKNDDPYIFGWSEAAGWDDMTDNEMRDNIIDWGYTGYYMSGAGSRDFSISGILNPETEYIVFVFGYEGGVGTTDLKRVRFTTGKAVVSDVVFEAEYGKYYDGDALLALYPSEFFGAEGKAVLPLRAKASPEEQVGSYMYHVLVGDYTDESSMSDTALRSYLEMQGRREEAASFYLEYDAVNTIVGVAKDKEGHYGKVYRQRITLTRDGVTPAEEYPR